MKTKFAMNEKRDIIRAITFAEDKLLLKKLKKKNLGHLTAPIKILQAHTRFLVANKLQFQNYRNSQEPVKEAIRKILDLVYLRDK